MENFNVTAQAACAIFGVTVDQLTPEMLKRARTVMHTTLYAGPTTSMETLYTDLADIERRVVDSLTDPTQGQPHEPP